MPDRSAEEHDERITIRGAREHNLKDVDLDIPRNRLVVVTGLYSKPRNTVTWTGPMGTSTSNSPLV